MTSNGSHFSFLIGYRLIVNIPNSLFIFSAARGDRRVGEGDRAAGRPGQVDRTGLLRMAQLPEGRAAQAVGAAGAGDQRAAGGPAPLPGKHVHERPQLQGRPAGEGAAR